MPYYRREKRNLRQSNSDSSGGIIILMILFSIAFWLYNVVSEIIKHNKLSDILIWSLIIVIVLFIVAQIYISTKRLAFESEKCDHGIAGGKTLNKCNLCVEEKKSLQIEKERLENEKIKLSKIQIESRKIERVFLEKLEAVRNSSLEKIRIIDPFEFEKVVAKLFQKLGYKVIQTPKSNDKGKDLILTKKSQKFLVECKRYGESKMVGRPDLQKFYAAIIEEEAEFGYFVTTSDFASTSKSYIKDINHKIKLINGADLIDLMKINFPNEGEDQCFELKCRECGENVQFGFPYEKMVYCSQNHGIITSEKSIRIRLNREQPQEAPECPKCQATMERRRSKRFNSNFWGCTNYPNCYGRLPYKF